MGTAYGQSIDYLFAGTVQPVGSPLHGQTLQTQLAAVDPNVVFTDNLYTPGEYVNADSVVAIGRNSLDVATAQTSRVYLAVGAMQIEEQFELPILILTRGTGPEQKPIRDRAVALFDAVAHFVQQDLTLGGVLLGGRYATIVDYLITQTETGDDQGGGAMQTVEIGITLQCKNYYTP